MRCEPRTCCSNYIIFLRYIVRQINFRTVFTFLDLELKVFLSSFFYTIPPILFLLPLYSLAFQQSLSILHLSLPRLPALHLYLILFYHLPFLVSLCKLLIIPVIMFLIQSFSVNLIIQTILDVIFLLLSFLPFPIQFLIASHTF